MQLDQIDRLISDRGYRFSFPEEIETAYHAYRLHFRKRLNQALLIPTLVCYNVFLIVDYLLLPETFWLSAALHLLLVSPIIVLSSMGLREGWDERKRDYCVALGPLAMIVQIMAIYALNASEAAQHYQYLAIFVLIYMNLLFRLEYDQAVAASAFAATLYVGTLFVCHAPLPVLVIGTMASGAACYLSLSGNRQMQRDSRHGYLRRMQDRLRIEAAQTAAERDVLTGLYNRRRLARAFDQLVDGSTSRTVALLMIDVDQFKRFNDENGHLAGDVCLRRIAEVLTQIFEGNDDLVVRFGGEEFLVLLTGIEQPHAVRLAERIRTEIEALGIVHADGTTHVTVSIGVTAGAICQGVQNALISGADAALYAAKQAGRNRVWPPTAQLASAAPAASAGLPLAV